MVEFLHMGGHGIYIWPGYIISLVLLLLGYIVSIKTTSRILTELKRFYSRIDRNN